MKKLSAFVKIPRSISIPFVVFIIIVSLSFQHSPLTISEKIDRHFSAQTAACRHLLKEWNSADYRNRSTAEARKSFQELRLAYKKLAVLSEYFNPYETKFLNGPALPRVEEDNPDAVIPPHGFQLLEERIFGKGMDEAAARELLYIDSILARMEIERDRIYKFRDEAVMDAMSASLIHITALGITGFDSPFAQFSLPEAIASLEGTADILSFYKEELKGSGSGQLQTILHKIEDAKTYILQHNQFNSFNRMAFIKEKINPLYSALSQLRKEGGFLFTEGRRPLDATAESFFSPDAYKISFFSPDESYQVNTQRVELGKKLFFDPLLSGNGRRSCASCHNPALAFTDGKAVAAGFEEGSSLKRNTPTLWNSVLQTRQFADSRADILENQLDEVVHNTEEMKGSLAKSVTDLRNDSVYSRMFQAAYPNDPTRITAYNIANAVSSYVRTLVAMNSRFDRYVSGDQTALSIEEIQGFNLFSGKAKCATCHFIPLFNGLVPPAFHETESEVIGVPARGKKKLDDDEGKYGFTKAEIHRFSFKTPGLRNCELTAPYMHNGAFKTLEEVVDFYNKGGGKSLKNAPANQTLPFDRLKLDKKEKAQIVAFLKTLTDTSYTYKGGTLR